MIDLSLAETQGLLDEIHVDFIANDHAVLEGCLVVGLCTLGFYVLLYCVDL
jgi:hypothetical protein